MKKSIFIFSLSILLTVQVFGQLSKEKMKRVNKLNQTDHQKLLGITELCPGASNNPESSNALTLFDSKSIGQSDHDTSRVHQLLRDGKNILDNAPKEASSFFERALNLSKSIQYEIGIARSYSLLGNVQHKTGELEKSMANYRNAIELAEDLEEKK